MIKDNSILKLIIELREDSKQVQNEHSYLILHKKIEEIIKYEIKRSKCEEDRVAWDRELKVEWSNFRRHEKRGNKSLPKNIPETLVAPYTFEKGNKLINKIAYSLSQIGSGTAANVVKQMLLLEPELDEENTFHKVKPLLNKLYNFGSIEGKKEFRPQIVYSLAAISYLFKRHDLYEC